LEESVLLHCSLVSQCPILSIIYNVSIKADKIPDDWRSAVITPAFKKGQKYVPANYRPISLACIWVQNPVVLPILHVLCRMFLHLLQLFVFCYIRRFENPLVSSCWDQWSETLRML
jgi:hypothetical protein